VNDDIDPRAALLDFLRSQIDEEAVNRLDAGFADYVAQPFRLRMVGALVICARGGCVTCSGARRSGEIMGRMTQGVGTAAIRFKAGLEEIA
jgi:hypothetical protein